MNRLTRLAFVLTGLATTMAQANDDSIFHSGIEPGLRIEGRVYWPGPVPGAVVTARFGDQIASTSARADGRYGLVIEYRHVTGTPPVELRARGTGAQSHIEYASQLGPFDRLQAAAGGDETLSHGEDAFVNLTPYSTAVTAYMRAESGFNPVADGVGFDRSARSIQWIYSNELALAVALAAQGDLALPAGSDTTWNALTSLSATQQFYADHMHARPSGACLDPPVNPYCTALATLPFDPEVLPSRTADPATIYSLSGGGFDYWGGSMSTAFIINGSSSAYQGTGISDGLQSVDSELLADGSYRLFHADGDPLQVQETWVFVGGVQVQRLIETMEVKARIARTVGNLEAVMFASTTRWRYPNNPEIPTTYQEGVLGLPRLSNSNPYPATQSGDLGPLANHRWVMTTPFPATGPNDNPGSRVADIHAFGVSGGTTERGGMAFSLNEQLADHFILGYGDQTSVVHLVNQDIPGIWRTRIVVTSPSATQVLSGILLQVDEPQPAWTAVNAPGLYRSYVNGHICNGPYADIELLYDNGFCISTEYSWWGFLLNSDGTGQQDPNNFPAPLIWTLPGPPNSGRLHINRMSGANLTVSRGWEIVKQSGNQIWMLENLVNGFPLPGPAEFLPTTRVMLYTRQ